MYYGENAKKKIREFAKKRNNCVLKTSGIRAFECIETSFLLIMAHKFIHIRDASGSHKNPQ